MSSDTVDGSGESGPFVTRYDSEADVPLSTALVFAVAEFEGCDPTTLSGPGDPRLADVVDPDFVDSLPESGTRSWRFEVELWGCRVVVTGVGTITVTRA